MITTRGITQFPPVVNWAFLQKEKSEKGWRLAAGLGPGLSTRRNMRTLIARIKVTLKLKQMRLDGIEEYMTQNLKLSYMNSLTMRKSRI